MGDKSFELLTNMYSEMTKQFDFVKGNIASLKDDVRGLKNDVIRIENNHGKKLDVLFDRYKQKSQILERFEKEVKRHDEIIIKCIK